MKKIFIWAVYNANLLSGIALLFSSAMWIYNKDYWWAISQFAFAVLAFEAHSEKLKTK